MLRHLAGGPPPPPPPGTVPQARRPGAAPGQPPAKRPRPCSTVLLPVAVPMPPAAAAVTALPFPPAWDRADHQIVAPKSAAAASPRT